MVRIKPARRPPLRVVSRVRTPLRKMSRPSHHPKSILSSRSQSRAASSIPSKISQKISRFLLALLAIFILLALVAFILFRSILSIALEDTSTHTVVLAPAATSDTASQVVFAFLSEQQTDSFMAVVPGSEVVMLPGDYGQYRISAIYPLLEQIEKKDEQFIQASFSRSLGRTVDTVYGTSEIVKDGKLDNGQLFGLILSVALKQKRVPVELIRLWHFVKKDIPLVTITSLKELPGLVAEKKTAVISQAQECPIGVLNASSQSGTASLLSTLFEQSGLITIRTSSYPQIEATTKIYISPDNKCQPVLDMVQKAFITIPPTESSEAMVTQYRAPIVIIIGEDFQ